MWRKVRKKGKKLEDNGTKRLEREKLRHIKRMTAKGVENNRKQIDKKTRGPIVGE